MPSTMPALEHRHEAPPWCGDMCKAPHLVPPVGGGLLNKPLFCANEVVINRYIKANNLNWEFNPKPPHPTDE